MADPKRIQRRRTKGWRMPEGAVYVGRPSRWGNPFTAGRFGHRGRQLTRADVVREYRAWLRSQIGLEPSFVAPLHGRDLACWCSLSAPCHADVLLELANG